MEEAQKAVLRLRHRAEAWAAAEQNLFEVNGISLAISAMTDGLGGHTPFLMASVEVSSERIVLDILDGEEARRRALLARMSEARPDEALRLQERWETWWSDQRGRWVRRCRRALSSPVASWCSAGDPLCFLVFGLMLGCWG